MAERGRRGDIGDETELIPLREETPIRTETKPTVKKKKKKNRKKQLLIRTTVVGIFAAALLGSGIYCIVDRAKDKNTMGCRVSIHDEDISWMTVEEAVDHIQETFQDTKVVFQENQKDIYEVTLGEAGYYLDSDSLTKELTAIRDARPQCHMLFEKHKNYDIPYQVEWKDESVRSAFSNDHMEEGVSRVPSKNAVIEFNDSTKKFEIIPSELGTVIDNAKLMNQIQQTLNASFESDLLKNEVPVTIDTTVYKVPDITEDNEDLKKTCKKDNKKYKSFNKASVTYTFGNVEETITNDMIQEWVRVEDGVIFLDETSIRDYIHQLGLDYDTQYVPREFVTSYGETITIENNEYGYWIDEDGEYDQLVKDIESGKKVKREPVYSSCGWKRNGNDDLYAGYVEVNLTDQRVWLYVDGEEILSTDCVTGQPTGINPKTYQAENRSTYEGSYPISYKEYKATLSSDIYGYEQDVDYWMPFVYGQGLHDAGWRASFGGNIYLWDGSHGCVNLPTYEASVIFSYVDTNFPVILYKTAPDPEMSYEDINQMSALYGTGSTDQTYTTDGYTDGTYQTYNYTDNTYGYTDQSYTTDSYDYGTDSGYTGY